MLRIHLYLFIILACVEEDGVQRELEGQVALVTGSARRLGKAIALELARAGSDILIHYGSTAEEVVAETLNELKQCEVRAEAKQADLSQAEASEDLVQCAVERWGRLDILVNSAAIFQKRELMEVTRQDWERTLAINLSAPFFLSQAAARIMKQNGRGTIIHLGDYGSLQPWPNYAHHGISKAALIMLTRTSALSLAPEIRVNAVIPGPVLRPEQMAEEAWSKISQSPPLAWGGDERSVAKAVRFLACHPAITGAVLPVDGGHSLTPPKWR